MFMCLQWLLNLAIVKNPSAREYPIYGKLENTPLLKSSLTSESQGLNEIYGREELMSV